MFGNMLKKILSTMKEKIEITDWDEFINKIDNLN